MSTLTFRSVDDVELLIDAVEVLIEKFRCSEAHEVDEREYHDDLVRRFDSLHDRLLIIRNTLRDTPKDYTLPSPRTCLGCGHSVGYHAPGGCIVIVNRLKKERCDCPGFDAPEEEKPWD